MKKSNDKGMMTTKFSKALKTLYNISISLFMCSLIFINLDFADCNEDEVNLNIIKDNDEIMTTQASFKNDDEDVCKILHYNFTTFSLIGECKVSNNDCTLNCKKAISNQGLIDRLEHQYNICKRPMELMLDATTFEENIFGLNDLIGTFQLINLTIRSSPLEKILDYAFDKNSLNNLEKLKIDDTEILEMNDKTFAGLKTLKSLYVRNIVQIKGEISAIEVLKPIAENLIDLFFEHKSEYPEPIDVGDWLQNADFIKLTEVSFIGNYFPNTLNKNSFKNLKSVEILKLQSCSIVIMENETFDAIMSTLRFLDLSNNAITSLSSHFIANAKNANFEMDLLGNSWDCSCTNYDFIEAVKNEEIYLQIIPICSRPIEHFHKDITSINLFCDDENNNKPTATTTTTTMTTIPSTIITSDTTITIDDTTLSTEITTTKPQKEIKLNCKSLIINDENLIHTMKDQLDYFIIKTLNSTSVQITFNNLLDKAGILYFNRFSSYHNNYQDINHDSFVINNLEQKLTYVFCMVTIDNDLTSPFNCRSHDLVDKNVKQTSTAWVTSDDLPLFIALSSVGIIIFLAIGLVFIYLLLRWRPKLLHHKRLIKLNAHSKKVILHDVDSDVCNNSSMFELTDPSYDYVKYLRGSQLPTTKIVGENNLESQPPNQRAPALPPIRESSLASTTSRLTSDDNFSLLELPLNFNEHDYQSLHDYQQIYGKALSERNN